MDKKQPTYTEGLGWRYEIEHSMLRRMHDHDYRGRSIYMVTLTTEGRQPLLGSLSYEQGKPENAKIVPTALGQEVIGCWKQIPCHYPEVRLLAFQLMPDHIHGLLFVTREQEAHVGQIVNGFKIGCNRAYRQLIESPETMPHNKGQESKRPKHSEHGLLFTPGYQDSVLKGKDQLDCMFHYIADNPRRLAEKKEKPDLFRIVRELVVKFPEALLHDISQAVPQDAEQTFAAIGNCWLLERPVRMQVKCHHNGQTENLLLIAKQKAYFLERGLKERAVVVSPCISSGEKEIARAALDAGVPLVVILENGFPPMYKPSGKYFEACCKGLLLMLAPWPYHMEKRTITRSQCLALNDIAYKLSTEPWTQELEEKVRTS